MKVQDLKIGNWYVVGIGRKPVNVQCLYSHGAGGFVFLNPVTNQTIRLYTAKRLRGEAQGPEELNEGTSVLTSEEQGAS